MEKFKKKLGVVSGEAYLLGLLVFVLLNLNNEWVAKDHWLSLGVWFVAVAMCVGEIAFAVYEGLDSSHFLETFSGMLIVQSIFLMIIGVLFFFFGHPWGDLLATNIFLHPTSGMLCLGLFSLGVSSLCKVVEKSYATNSSPLLVSDGYHVAVAFTLVCFSVYLDGAIYVLPLKEETIGLFFMFTIVGVIATIVMGVMKLIAGFWQRKR